jgi:hypothetical protein
LIDREVSDVVVCRPARLFPCALFGPNSRDFRLDMAPHDPECGK